MTVGMLLFGVLSSWSTVANEDLPQTASRCVVITSKSSPNWKTLSELSPNVGDMRRQLNDSGLLDRGSMSLQELTKNTFVLLDRECSLFANSERNISQFRIAARMADGQPLTLGSFEGMDRKFLEDQCRRTFPHLKDGPLPDSLGICYEVTSFYKFQHNGKAAGLTGSRLTTKIDTMKLPEAKDIFDKAKLEELINEQKQRHSAPDVSGEVTSSLEIKCFPPGPSQPAVQAVSEATGWLQIQLAELRRREHDAAESAFNAFFDVMNMRGEKTFPSLGTAFKDGEAKLALSLSEEMKEKWKERGFESQTAALEWLDSLLNSQSQQVMHIGFLYRDGSILNGSFEDLGYRG